MWIFMGCIHINYVLLSQLNLPVAIYTSMYDYNFFHVEIICNVEKCIIIP